MVVATYLLLVIRSLEDLAIAEIQEKLEVVSIEVLTLQADPERKHRLDVERGQAAVGKLVVHTTSSPERVKSLCSVQAFLAYIAHSDALTTTDEVAGPEQIATLVEQSSRWNDALVLWKLHVPSTESSIRFRASCVRDGTHKYSSEVIAGKVGAAIVRKFHWTVSLVDFDLEVVAIVMHHDVICGISLAADPKTINFRGARLAPEPRRLASFQYMSTLRPSTAYLMLQLATCNAGDVVLDCMCGVGTIPACSSHWAPVFGLGGDVSPDAVAQARVNLQQSPRAAVCLWSSERLPLRPESVDRILVDMPFGIQCGNATKNSRLYPKALQEMARVLRPNGTAVLLVLSKKMLEHSVRNAPSLTIQKDLVVNIGGLAIRLYVLVKTNDMKLKKHQEETIIYEPKTTSVGSILRNEYSPRPSNYAKRFKQQS